MTTKHKHVNFEFDHMEFGLAMSGVMQAENITDEDLGDIVGLDHSTVGNYRTAMAKGKWYPSMGTFLKICNALDIDPRQYFSLEDSI